ncbi:MAG: hypothetical protein AAF662_04910 [Pseudomonadota bacterium]
MEMEKQDVQHAAQRYARGELKGKELDGFEDYLMEHPELLEQIETESVLKNAIDAEVVPLRSRPSIHRTAQSKFQPFAAAACLMIALGAVYFAATAQRDPSGAVISDELRFEPLRSGGTSSIPYIESGKGLTLFSVDVGLRPGDVSQLIITGSDGHEALRFSDLSVIDGYVQFTVGDLAADTYRLAIYNQPDAAASASYDFQVRSR